MQVRGVRAGRGDALSEGRDGILGTSAVSEIQFGVERRAEIEATPVDPASCAALANRSLLRLGAGWRAGLRSDQGDTPGIQTDLLSAAAVAEACALSPGASVFRDNEMSVVTPGHGIGGVTRKPIARRLCRGVTPQLGNHDCGGSGTF